MAGKAAKPMTKPAMPKMDAHAAELARRAANLRASKLQEAESAKKHRDEMARREANLRKARSR